MLNVLQWPCTLESHGMASGRIVPAATSHAVHALTVKFDRRQTVCSAHVCSGVDCRAIPSLHDSCVGLQAFLCFERANANATCSHLPGICFEKWVTARGAEQKVMIIRMRWNMISLVPITNVLNHIGKTQWCCKMCSITTHRKQYNRQIIKTMHWATLRIHLKQLTKPSGLSLQRR